MYIYKFDEIQNDYLSESIAGDELKKYAPASQGEFTYSF